MKIKSWFWYLIAAVATLTITILVGIDKIPVTSVGNIEAEYVKEFLYGFLKIVFVLCFISMIVKKVRELQFPNVVLIAFVSNVIVYFMDVILDGFSPTGYAQFFGDTVGYIVLVAGYYIIKVTREKRWKELL